MTVDTQELPAVRSLGTLEPVAYFDGAMPTGVTVSHQGRIFVNFPKWGDEVLFTVAEVRDGRPVAYPNEAINRPDSGNSAATLVSVQSVVIDPADRLWILDTGSPLFQPTQHGGPKLVCVDLASNRVVKTILFPQDIALPTSYLNDVRFDLRRGAEGMASSPTHPTGARMGSLWWIWHPVKAGGACMTILRRRPRDCKAFSRLSRGVLCWSASRMARSGRSSRWARMGSPSARTGHACTTCPLASRRLYSVATDALADRWLDEVAVATTVADEGDRGGASDGLESDAAGHLYSTNYEHNAILRRDADGKWETVVYDPRLLWPDTLSVAADGYLYVTANQLHRPGELSGWPRPAPEALYAVSRPHRRSACLAAVTLPPEKRSDGTQ